MVICSRKLGRARNEPGSGWRFVFDMFDPSLGVPRHFMDGIFTAIFIVSQVLAMRVLLQFYTKLENKEATSTHNIFLSVIFRRNIGYICYPQHPHNCI